MHDKMRRVGVFCVLFVFSLLLFSLFYGLPASAIATQSSISLSVDTSSPSFNILPLASGTFGKTSDITINVNTDNFTGYSIRIATVNSTSMVSSNENEIESISSAVSESDFISNSSYSNKWGYKPSQYISSENNTNTVVQNTDYLPAPSTEGDLLDITNAANSTDNSYTLAFGAKADLTLPPGSYVYTYNIMVVPNSVVYNITYDENSTGTVTSMPNPNPQALSVDGGTPAAESYANLSSSLPVLADMTFGGWCDVPTTIDSVTNNYLCSGTTYQPGDPYPIDQTQGANITLYAIWLDDPFPIAWSQMGKCVFHGNQPSNITGDECTAYHNSTYIDTGVALYSQANASKDYEIHFKIEKYVPGDNTGNDGQQTFVSDKVPSTTTIGGGSAPGLVVRKNSNNISFSSKMNSDSPAANIASSKVDEVSVYRINHIIYYSINSGPLVLLHDITGFNQYFDLTTWFGAYPSTSGCDGSQANPCSGAKRFIEAEFSNMYIRLGDFDDSKLHELTFYDNDGTSANTKLLVMDGNSISALPEVLRTGWIFNGWWTAQTGGEEITASTIPDSNADYYAHWVLSVSEAQIPKTDFSLSIGESETIEVTNASNIESYSLVSNDVSVATVDQQTGVITAVGVGSTTLTMTGAKSGDVRTINVEVGNTITVDFDSQGGDPATYEWTIVEGYAFNELPDPIRVGYSLEGWYTEPNGAGTKLTTSTLFDSNTASSYYANWEEIEYVCKIAESLHTETCEAANGKGCRAAGFAQNSTIIYGNLIESSTKNYGDAYNCDINNDGIYSEETERFYYIGTNNKVVSLIYYKNEPGDANYSWTNGSAALPDSTLWTNPNLIAQDTKVSRFMTREELNTICGGTSQVGYKLNDTVVDNTAKGKCGYVTESSTFAHAANTGYLNTIWLQRIGTTNWRVNLLDNQAAQSASSTSNNGVRPVIEVPINMIQPYTPPVLSYTITFDPHNGESADTVTINVNEPLGNNYPATNPLYNYHLFQGWYTDVAGGTLVTNETVPAGNVTYHAQWKKTVTLAELQKSSISVLDNGSATIIVTNAAELESYSFSSDDDSIATVNPTTGVVTGVSAGSTTIVMSGTTSHETKNIDVSVIDSSTVHLVAFDPRNGEPTSTELVPINDTIGTTRMPAEPTYANRVFERWYDISNNNTVTYQTVPNGDMTVYAEWKLDVTQASISNDLILEVGDQISIVVGNAADLETYTFSSLNGSIATVGENTGVITGIGEGTTSVIMTGTKSHLTKALEVNVSAAPSITHNVTFNSNGGTTPSPQASYSIVDGDPVGNLPTTERINYRFFGWYKDDGTFYQEVTPETIIEDDVTFYARWIEDTTSFPIEFAEINECIFNGNAVISGTYCTQDKTKKFVNSGVALFSTTNYQKDFEIGFTVLELAATQPNTQGTLVNSKYENSSLNYPGFVMRSLSTGPNFELTGRFSNGSPAQTFTNFANSTPTRVKIVRQGGVLKYSINDAPLTPWFDANNNEHRFDTNVWFGAAAASNGTTPQRYLAGRMTDMYVKLGAPTEYIINFNVNDGSFVDPSESSRTVSINSELGTLPVPVPPSSSYTFAGWWDESVSPAVQVTASTIPTSNKTYVAHYTYASSDVPVLFDVSNDATRGYQALVDDWIISPINLTTFNKATPINNSTWGDTTELSDLEYWTEIRKNFVDNNCLIMSSGAAYSDAVKPLSALSDWTSGSVDCSKPDAYDTKINAPLNVYLDNDQGALVSYAKADNGVIHNMIPGQTYYWEKQDDSTVYGYVTATSKNGTRWVDTGTIRNVRDLGGLPVTYTDGNNQTITGTLKYGRLFRGEKLNNAAATELTNLGITTEYNVGDEYNSDTHLTDYHLNQVIHYNFDYNSGDEENSGSNYMKAWTAVTNIMTDIVNTNTTKNVYFHCRVGADRTGTVAYLLEGLLGVPDEMRYEEYSLTNVSGLYDRTRYYKQKASNNANKFVFMMGYVRTNSEIYDWYMHNPSADPSLIQSFRTAMTNIESSSSNNNSQQNTNSINPQSLNTSNMGDMTNANNSSFGYAVPLGVTTSSVSSSDNTDGNKQMTSAIWAAAVAGASIATGGALLVVAHRRKK